MFRERGPCLDEIDIERQVEKIETREFERLRECWEASSEKNKKVLWNLSVEKMWVVFSKKKKKYG